MTLHANVPTKSGELECTVCGGKGKSAPTDCPGRRLNNEELHKIEAQFLDYYQGKWKHYAVMDWGLDSRSTSALKRPGTLPDSSSV